MPGINLNKPSKSTQNWHTPLNENFDNIDNKFDNIDTNHQNHLNSTSAHQAQNVPYTGNVVGATQTKQAIDSLKTQIDQATIGAGTSPAEVTSARDGATGETNATLKDRLDKVEVSIGRVTNLSANITLTNTQRGIINITTSTTDKTITLPTAVSNAVVRFTIKKVDSAVGMVTIACSGGQLIDGVATKILRTKDESITVVSNGSGWSVVGETKNETEQMSAPITTFDSVISLPSTAIKGQVSVSLFGNTRTNLLGDAGDFETLTGWTELISTAGGTSTLSTTQKLFSGNSIRFNNTGGSLLRHRDISGLDATKYYEVTVYVFIESYTSGGFRLMLSDSGGFTNLVSANPNYTVLNQWQRIKLKFTGKNAIRISVENGVTTTGIAYFDGGMLREVTLAEFNDANNLTPGYINATKSTFPEGGRIKSVGKNLFDGKWESGTLSTVSGIESVNASLIRFVNFIRINPSTQYEISNNAVGFAGGLTRYYMFYDSNKNFISYLDTFSQFTTPSNAYYVRVTVSAGISEDNKTKTQIALGSTSTAYEVFKNGGEAYIPALDLKSVPNAKDEIREVSGRVEHVKRVSDDVIINGNSIEIIGSGDNVQRVRTIVYDPYVGGLNSQIDGRTRVPGWNETANLLAPATTADIGKYYSGSDKRIDFYFALGTFANLNAAKAWFNANPQLLTYQLLEFVTTPLTNLGQLTAHPNGTIFIEPIVKQSNTHGEGIYLNQPIRWLESVSRIDGSTETLINPSNVTIRRRAGTSTAESGTTTTNIRITGHNLIVGSRIRNTTRGNAIRQVTAVVDANNVTVAAITGMTTGDTIERYTVTPTDTTLPAIISVTGATSSQVYKTIYEYPSELTTQPETSVSYPINIAASISSNTNMIVAVNKQVIDLNDFTVALLLNHEARLVSLGV